jgi:hypothetical protein
MNRTVAVGVLIFTAVFCPRAAGQDDPRRRASDEAKAQDVQRAIQAKRDEIMKAVSDLAVLRAKSEELELKIRKLRDELAQEERRLQARAEETALREQEEKARENLKASYATIVRFKEDQGRGGEEKLDTILKRLESIEKRLSDLEKKVQPDRRKK